jgi:hypothetical protein
MKTLRILLAAFAAAFTFTARTIAAPEGHGHSHGDKPEWAELFGDASLPVVWQSATASAENISKALAEKKLEGVSSWAETIHLASHALIDQVKIEDVEKKKRLISAFDQAAKIADEVLDAAQHNETEKAAASFKRLNAALTLAKSRLPKEITDAPSQTPRFAKVGAHTHDENGKHAH